ncbi:uncharacterized protein LOC129615824 [Condylostylus longicornis]|uniref:uncharacterized protein LOC129615824 n=1 Tax=Condylostylus longicornis TaxID=2530218 RepID=UPI00244E0D04|nr:uncharacterized protein LOC129615824 [Condylostylus longicornis]
MNMKPASERNVEIKAKIGSDEEFQKRIDIAKNLTSSIGELIIQRDVFFKSQSGRLKLRYLQPPSKSQLLYYDRPDLEGPKLSQYDKIEVDEPEKLEKILATTNGIIGIVKKERLLFMHQTTRIHLDKVEGLGNYLEFEVGLSVEQTVEEGQKIAKEMMETFQINEKDLIVGAYLDKLNK